MHAQSCTESDRAGAFAFAGHRPKLPLAQKVSLGHGVHPVPLDALPWNPGRQVHWVTAALPSGEIEFSGQVARVATGGDALLNPSIVRLARRIASCVALVSFETISTEKSMESVVTCSKRRGAAWYVAEAEPRSSNSAPAARIFCMPFLIFYTVSFTRQSDL